MTLPIVERLRSVVPADFTYSRPPGCTFNEDGPEAASAIEELVEALKHCRDRFVRDGTSTFIVDGALTKLGGSQ